MKTINIRSIIIALVIASAVAMFTIFAINTSQRYWLNMATTDLRYMASDLALRIDADAHSTIQLPDDKDSIPYNTITAILLEYLSSKPDLRSAYTFRIIDGNVRVIVSPPEGRKKDGSAAGVLKNRDPVGYLYNRITPPEMADAFHGKNPAGGSFIEDARGISLAGCAPIMRSDGKIDAGICVDENAEPIKQRIFFANIIVSVVSILAGLAFATSLAMFLNARKLLKTQIVTEKKRAAEYRSFGEIFNDATEIAVHGYDHNGNIWFWNRASEIIHGIPRSEAIGKNISEIFIAVPAAEDLKRQIGFAAANKNALSPYEWKIKTKQGHEVYLLSVMFPMKDEKNKAEVFCMDFDISKQNISKLELEKQLERFKALQDSLLKREERMIEIKKEVNELMAKLGDKPKYVV